jgi:hypothetical protein
LVDHDAILHPSIDPKGRLPRQPLDLDMAYSC